jgi:hypothetical protein
MAMFHAESVTIAYASVEAARDWWTRVFDCYQVPLPADWDDSLPSDVALKLPGQDRPAILLCDRAEATQARLDRTPSPVPIVFCSKTKKAFEYLLSRGLLASPIQSDGSTTFFAIRDLEGDTIEIAEEP